MEIQGLSGAQNIQSQHGALHRTSPTGPTPRLICSENKAGGQAESCEPQSDNNNNTRPRTSSSFRLLAENGSGTCLSARKPQPTDRLSLPGPSFGLLGVNTDKENELGAQEPPRAAWKCGPESGDGVVPMALPLFDGEEEPPPQRQQPTFPFPALRQQQREHGAAKQPSPPSYGAAAPGSLNAASRADKSLQELYVVFNVVQENGGGGEAARAAADGDQIRAATAAPCGSMEPGNLGGVLRCDSHELRSASDPSRLRLCRHTVEDVVLTNKYGEKICGQMCTESDEAKLLREFPSQPRVDLVSGSPGVVEAMDTSGFLSDPPSLRDSAGPPSSETFSGTITINNQSIIVTIENGLLTLAAPPEGYVHKDDDMLSLKEHLGMKDHEDIVLLNYDSGTKSIGKISTLAVSSSVQQEEPRPGLSVSDSELGLADDCSLSELGRSLDSCPMIKQEVGALCAAAERDLVAASPKTTVADNEDLQSAPLIRSKKETVASFDCPEPGCASRFDTRQKLKVHLLNHAEDPRPYQCTLEGCGWAFATSYKLKRHLKSHDKQRPHTCQFEGCGRRFTTVYNLRAHIRGHQQDNSFICEICSERFRSATRLTNHQRVHFEPQRPHKCEFPGNTGFHSFVVVSHECTVSESVMSVFIISLIGKPPLSSSQAVRKPSSPSVPSSPTIAPTSEKRATSPAPTRAAIRRTIRPVASRST